MPLLDLPQELRTRIFEYVFTAPDGTITICTLNSSDDSVFTIHAAGPTRWVDSANPLRLLPILRASRLIYNDCKNLLWKCNRFCIIDRDYPIFDLPASVKSQVKSVVGVIAFFEMARRRGMLPLREDFIHLSSFHGLKSLDLAVQFEPNSMGGYGEKDKLQRLLKYRDCPWSPGSVLYDTYLGILTAAGGEGGYLEHLERRLLVDTYDQWDQRRENPTYDYNRGFNDDGSPEIFFHAENGDPNEMLAEMSCAFGGSLVVNGIVCMRNRTQVGILFSPVRTGKDSTGVSKIIGWHYLEDAYMQAMIHLSLDHWGWRPAFDGDGSDLKLIVNIAWLRVQLKSGNMLQYADLPQFARLQDEVRAYKALIKSMRSTVEISR